MDKDIGAAGTFIADKNPKRSVYPGTSSPIRKKEYQIKVVKKTNEAAKDLGLDLTDPRQRRKAQSSKVARGLKKKIKQTKK